MIYKTSLVIALALVGVGLILNGVGATRSAGANAELPALVGVGEYVPVSQSENPAPSSAVPDLPIGYNEVLANLHPGQWWSWTDQNNQTYENLIVIDNQYSKPSKAVLDSLVDSAQSTKTNKRSARNTRESMRVDLETAIANGSATNAQIRAYLRLLGDF